MTVRRIIIGSTGSGLWRLTCLAGAALVLAGILIAMFPQILIVLISSVLILAGLTLLGAGWRVRSFEQAHRLDGTHDVDVIDL